MEDKEKEHKEEIERLERECEQYSMKIKVYSKVRVVCWILWIIGIIVVPKDFATICGFVMFALFISFMPFNAKQKYDSLVTEIRQKSWQYENSPDKAREREKERIETQIEMYTPFKDLEEKGDYYISSVSWDLTENEDKLIGVNVILLSETKSMKNLYYKYKGSGKTIKAPVGMEDEQYLRLSRSKMYLLREEKKYEECEKLFREVFEKDPFTGADIEANIK